jgi:isovaleryl-CoA dehydrogenase
LRTYPDALERVVTDVVAPGATATDTAGSFPRAAIDALAEAGILGLTAPPELGGGGGALREAAAVVERLAGACGSTAMVVLMHYAATAAIEAHGPKEVRQAIADGRHLSTLAFSETGSRSQFWAPVSTATADADGDNVVLDAAKSWVTAGAEADSYVWSSRPVGADGGPMTLWLVDAGTAGLTRPTAGFDGVGLRGNGSIPITAEGVTVPLAARLGDDGAGLDVALTSCLPWFLVLSGAFGLGILEAVAADTLAHLVGTRLEHVGRPLIADPVIRADYARLRLATDRVRAFLDDTLTALETGRADAQLRVLEIKALAAEEAADGCDRAMKLCGGAAFRKETGIERRFRDSLAARVMAPTTDALLDFVGRAVAGLPLLGDPGGSGVSPGDPGGSGVSPGDAP